MFTKHRCCDLSLKSSITTAANMTCSDSDIIVVLDSSGTIGDSWPILKQFTIDLINSLMMRDSLIRIGIVAYAYQV